MVRGKKISPEICQKIHSLREQGISLNAISTALDIPVSSISSILKKNINDETNQQQKHFSNDDADEPIQHKRKHSSSEDNDKYFPIEKQADLFSKMFIPAQKYYKKMKKYNIPMDTNELKEYILNNIEFSEDENNSENEYGDYGEYSKYGEYNNEQYINQNIKEKGEKNIKEKEEKNNNSNENEDEKLLLKSLESKLNKFKEEESNMNNLLDMLKFKNSVV